MKYPMYLSVGNWLFKHIQLDDFLGKNPVGGPVPENLYISISTYRCIDFSRDLRTYEGLIAYGCKEPDDKELLRLLK